MIVAFFKLIWYSFVLFFLVLFGACTVAAVQTVSEGHDWNAGNDLPTSTSTTTVTTRPPQAAECNSKDVLDEVLNGKYDLYKRYNCDYVPYSRQTPTYNTPSYNTPSYSPPSYSPPSGGSGGSRRWCNQYGCGYR